MHKNEILNGFRSGKRLTGKDGLLTQLIKNLHKQKLNHILLMIFYLERVIEEMVLTLKP